MSSLLDSKTGTERELNQNGWTGVGLFYLMGVSQSGYFFVLSQVQAKEHEWDMKQ